MVDIAAKIGFAIIWLLLMILGYYIIHGSEKER